MSLKTSQMNRLLKISLFWLVAVLVITALGYSGWRTLFQPSLSNKPSKIGLLQMHHSLKLGDSEQRVDQVF